MTLYSFTAIARPRKRVTERLIKTALTPDAKDVERWRDASRSWHLTFRRSPKQFLSDDDVRVSGIKFDINRLEVG